MTTRDAFLSAIIADPADDLPRLQFADWLEENGEAERAEFIRKGCGPERYCYSIPTNDEHCTRELFGLDLSLGYFIKRGFIAELRGPLAALLQHGPAICRENPVTAVSVTVAMPHRLKSGGWRLHYPGLNALKLDPKLKLVLSGFFKTRRYESTEAAMAALNAATLAELRRLATSPKLA